MKNIYTFYENACLPLSQCTMTLVYILSVMVIAMHFEFDSSDVDLFAYPLQNIHSFIFFAATQILDRWHYSNIDHTEANS